MRFTFEGQTFAIEFQRFHTWRKVWVPRLETVNGIPLPVFDQRGKPVYDVEDQLSTYPYTTARVMAETGPSTWAEYQSATVGARHNEEYNPELGRRYALRNLTRTLPIGMRPLVWKTYLGRKAGKVS